MHRHLIALLTAALVMFGQPAGAEGLRRLDTGTASRGWEAVGRLDLDGEGFCTGALIAPDQVLTAAHCLWDRETGRQITPERIEFRAGWRNGRAAAYRQVRRTVVHPEHVFDADESLGRVRHDLALLELTTPIRLPSLRPYELAPPPDASATVGVVSYARDRAEAPSLQSGCQVLAQQSGTMVIACDVDFGASGAPVFQMVDGVAHIVSVVTAKAEMAGNKVALASDPGAAIHILQDQLLIPITGPRRIQSSSTRHTPTRTPTETTGPRFVRPPS